MRRVESTSRPAGLALTATTFVALVAMAAGAAAAPLPVEGDAIAPLRETAAARVVAAAVAAARDLLSGGASHAVRPPARPEVVVVRNEARAVWPESPRRHARPDAPLRVLDLPPPAC